MNTCNIDTKCKLFSIVQNLFVCSIICNIMHKSSIDGTLVPSLPVPVKGVL